MRTTTLRFAPALALALLSYHPASQALVMQRVEVFSETVTLPILDTDPFEGGVTHEVRGTTSADITSASYGHIADSVASNSVPGAVTYDASASIGQFGSVGLEASASGGISASETYELSSRVIIRSDEYMNVLGTPQHAVANFIIDGGEMRMFGAKSSIEYTLFVNAENLGPVGIEPASGSLSVFPDYQFFSAGLFEATGTSMNLFTADGRDIGATHSTTDQTLVEIPLSFQSLDLGIINPGERLALEYDFTFTLKMEGPGSFAEIMHAQFSDPLSLSGTPVLDVQFSPVSGTSTIPVPSALLLLAVGIPLAARWRQSA